MNQEITQAELKKDFLYDPDTGVFTRIIRRGKAETRVCNCKTAAGYVLIGYKCKRHYAHRLAFVYMTGDWPIGEVDHINNIPDDNRFSNLREATRRQNCANMAARVTSRSGVKGVYFTHNCPLNPWRAEIYLGRNIFLGNFPTIEAASNAYAKAALQEHGEFAKYG